MPPKAAFMPGGGPPLPQNIRVGVHPNEAVIIWQNQTVGNPGFPRVTAVEQSDIFTYPTQAIVIATDVGMNRRNEYPPTKFHLLAGPNLGIWNRACNYKSRLNTATGIITRSSLLERNGVTSAVRAPAFRTTSHNWIIMVNVPTFVNGPADPVTGFRGNGGQLYQCYIRAFEAARENANYNVPASVRGNLPPVVTAGGGLNAAALPRSIAFSFMGPSHGWDVQEAGNIAMKAIRDSFWTQPPGVPLAAGLSLPAINFNRLRFNTVSICGTFVVGDNPDTPLHRAQKRALRAAFRWQFQGQARPAVAIPPPPPLPPLPPPPPPVGPLAKVTRSGRGY